MPKTVYKDIHIWKETSRQRQYMYEKRPIQRDITNEKRPIQRDTTNEKNQYTETYTYGKRHIDIERHTYMTRDLYKERSSVKKP